MSRAVSRFPFSAYSGCYRRRDDRISSSSVTCCLAGSHNNTSSSTSSSSVLVFNQPTIQTTTFPDHPPGGDTDEDADPVWSEIRNEATRDTIEEPILHSLYESSILSHPCLESSLASLMSSKLSTSLLPAGVLFDLFLTTFRENTSLRISTRADLTAARDRDPACSKMVHCFLYYKGFLVLQSHRVANKLWMDGRRSLAFFIQSRVSEVFAVDIHPGARIGSGILLDHATGVVIGETAVVGDNVSILHNVTLGGTGKESGDRHPKLGDGVLVGAGTQILGSVIVGEGAKIGAGSVVLKDVPARTTAVGNPAKLLGGKENPIKLDRMPSLTMDHTSWSDYVI